jgi:glycosyltransferase involved in cell wall biosynthesis
MSNSLVSFIIPYFNAGSTIQETIDSIFNQSYPNFDIWLVNDGSTDQHSIDKLKEFEGNEKIHLLDQENAGPSTARNKGILNSNADFFVFLDADDLIEKETLNFALENIGEYDVLFGDCTYFGQRNSIKKQVLPSSQEILINNPIAVCTLTKATTIKQILFDSTLDKIGLEDWELWIHLFSLDYKFIYFDQLLFKIRVLENSRTFQVANKNIPIAKKYIFKKHSEFVHAEYLSIYQEKKEIVSNIDYKIGKWILYPYRLIKQSIKKK